MPRPRAAAHPRSDWLGYFAGLSVQEAAELLGISRATADRYGAYAKVWLYCQVTAEEGSAGRLRARSKPHYYGVAVSTVRSL